MVPRPLEQDPAGPDRNQPPAASGRRYGGFGRRGLDAGAAAADGLALSDVTLRIEDGLLMAFGPNGDPLPPAVFAAAAHDQPATSVRLGEDTTVAPLRAAAVLEAQIKGPLAGAAESAAAESWIRSMLGLGPQPATAAATELEGERRVCELTAFARELMISLPTGGTFLITEAAPSATAAAGLVLADGTQIALARLIERIRAALGPRPAPHQTPAGAPPRAADIALPECGIGLAGGAIVLELPSIGAVRLVDVAGATPQGPRVGLFRADGAPAKVADLAASLAPDRLPEGGSDERTPARDPSSGDTMVLSLDWPEMIELAADGTADLGMLARALEACRAQLPSATVVGLPVGASLSAGRRHADGSWSLAAEDLRALRLRTSPVARGDLALEITVRALQGEATRTLTVRRPPRPQPTETAAPPQPQPTETAAPPQLQPAEDAARPHPQPAAAAGRPQPQRPEAAVRMQPQRPEAAVRMQPQRPEAAVRTQPERPEAAVRTQPQPPEAAAPPRPQIAAAAGAPVAAAAADGAAPIRLAVRLPAGAGANRKDVALVILRGVPPGAALSAGIDNGDGSWMLSPQDLVGLELSLPAGCGADLTLEVTALAVTSREGEMASAAERLRLSLGAPARPLPLAIDRAAVHGLQALMIRDLPEGARLSAGTYDPAIDAWVVLPRQLDGLCVIPARAGAGFTATVMGFARGADGRTETRLLSRLPVAPA